MFIDRYQQKYDKKDIYIYIADLRGTQHFIIYSWVFPLMRKEEKCFLNCGDLPGNCRSIRDMRLYSRYSEDEEGLSQLIADIFMSVKAILSK